MRRTSRVATVEAGTTTLRSCSIVATRLVPILAIHVRGLKPTATFGSRYAANAKNPGGYFGTRCYKMHARRAFYGRRL
jgi:hypothetical protein